jgi:anti-sigma factor RsiW
MSLHRSDDCIAARPELLAAYADGELDPDMSALVEAWLAQHPERAAELEGQRLATQLYQANPPAEPTEERWDRMMLFIKHQSVRRALDKKQGRLGFWVAAGIAAAVFIAVILFSVRPKETPGLAEKKSPETSNSAAEEFAGVFPVAGAEDIVISSMDDDHAALVVGEPPVQGTLAMAGPGDVEINDVRTDMQGMTPEYPREPDRAPMVYMVPVNPTPEPKDP